jgi:hypothetical protein
MDQRRSKMSFIPPIWLKVKGRGGPRGKESEMIIDVFVTDMKRVGPYMSDKPLRPPRRQTPEERRMLDNDDAAGDAPAA